VAGRSRKSGRCLLTGRHLRALQSRPGSFDTGPFDEPPLARGAVENDDGIEVIKAQTCSFRTSLRTRVQPLAALPALVFCSEHEWPVPVSCSAARYLL
jgi:hypothetical protein